MSRGRNTQNLPEIQILPAKWPDTFLTETGGGAVGGAGAGAGEGAGAVIGAGTGKRAGTVK